MGRSVIASFVGAVFCAACSSSSAESPSRSGGGGDANVGTGGDANVGTGGDANVGTGGDANVGTGGDANVGTGGTTGGAAADGGGSSSCGTGGRALTTAIDGQCRIDSCEGYGAALPPLGSPAGSVTLSYDATITTLFLSGGAAGNRVTFSSENQAANQVTIEPPAVSATVPTDFFGVGDRVDVHAATFSGVVAVPEPVSVRIFGELGPPASSGNSDSGAQAPAGDAGTDAGLISSRSITRFVWPPLATGEIDVYVVSLFAPDLLHDVSSVECSAPATTGHLELHDPSGSWAMSQGAGAVFSVVRAEATPSTPGISIVARRSLATFDLPPGK